MKKETTTAKSRMSQIAMFVAVALVMAFVVAVPLSANEDTSYDPEWVQEVAPCDSTLKVGVSAPRTGMTKETTVDMYYGVMVTFYNADYNATYHVDHCLDTSPKEGVASYDSSYEDISSRNSVHFISGSEMAGGHLFYVRSGQWLEFSNLPRYIDYSVKTFAPEAFDTMYRIKRQKINQTDKVAYKSMSGPELESTLGNDNVTVVAELALVSPWMYG